MGEHIQHTEEKQRVTEAEIAIFDNTFTALEDVDEQYRRDSELYLAQRNAHKERIENSQSELERLEKLATIREKELNVHRKKIATAALKLYGNYPEISEDHARVFALAGQLNYGRNLETNELNIMKSSLLSLDAAVAEHRLILRTMNGNFDSLIIPETGASGLVPEVVEKKHSWEPEGSVKLSLPIEYWLVFFDRSQFPSTRGGESLNVFADFLSYDTDKRQYQTSPTPAKIASSYDVRYEFPRSQNKEEKSEPITYVIGEEMIQELIIHSGNKKELFGPNTELAFKTWLASKVAGYDLACNLEDLIEPIVGNMSKIIETSAMGYGDSHVASIDSEVAGILLEAIRSLGAEDVLYEEFSAQLVGHYGQRSIYKDPMIVRTVFDAILQIPNK